MIEKNPADSILRTPAISTISLVDHREHRRHRDIQYQEIIGPRGYNTPHEVVGAICTAASHSSEVMALDNNPLYISDLSLFSQFNVEDLELKEKGPLVRKIHNLLTITLEDFIKDLESRGFGMYEGIDMREHILQRIPAHMPFSLQPMYYYYQNILGIVQRHNQTRDISIPYRTLIASL